MRFLSDYRFFTPVVFMDAMPQALAIVLRHKCDFADVPIDGYSLQQKPAWWAIDPPFEKANVSVFGAL